jgi:hypothetical protein
MKTHLACLIAGLLLLASSAAFATAPKGWLLSGDDAREYESGIDHTISHRGGTSGFLRARVAEPRGFGTLMQQFNPEAYRGKRVRFSATLRSVGVTGWAGLWMRVDTEQRPAVAFDNMEDRAVRGNTDWTAYEVVLDVAPDASDLAFGVLVVGGGEVWMDDVRIEAVSTSVPTTGRRGGGQVLPGQPEKLDFRE